MQPSDHCKRRMVPAGCFRMFSQVGPGIIGVDFAKDVDRAFGQLRSGDRLVIDLRGNPGGASARYV